MMYNKYNCTERPQKIEAKGKVTRYKYNGNFLPLKMIAKIVVFEKGRDGVEDLFRCQAFKNVYVLLNKKEETVFLEDIWKHEDRVKKYLKISYR